MTRVDTHNQYHRTTVIIDRFDDGTQELVKHEAETVDPPCIGSGYGCRASSYDQEHCEFAPKTGLCAGRMP